MPEKTGSYDWKARTNEKFHRIDGLRPADIESQVHDYVMEQMKLEVQAGETKVSGRGNWSFKRGKLKFHTQETLGEKQDGKDSA